MTKKSKLLHLSPECVETLTIVAIKQKRVFKTFCEEFLEKLAETHRNIELQSNVRGAKKNKNK